MAKRNSGDDAESEDKRRRLLQDPEVQADSGRVIKRNPLLEEDFAVNCPVHGLMFLPSYAKLVVDSETFQRMRHIKQLGVCALVFPGATHNRFFHSIGTGYLAYELMKSIQYRQPELHVTDRDMVCVTLAGLCHDLGHPCFSHMFESFMHMQGHAGWTHEQASIVLVTQLLDSIKDQLCQAGLLGADVEGDDVQFIKELIDPPKKLLDQASQLRELKDKWAELMKGRPVEKAWMYEIVSNWRTGIDVDKFDYFRRDALYLGIQRQFDHQRYLKSVRIILDQTGVSTVSPPEKDKDNLRENLMELRKTLHRTAYQHKTVKKLEQHMIDVLKLLDKKVKVTTADGRKLSISEAALEVHSGAYAKLTDLFIESRLLEAEDPNLQEACDIYKRRFLQRKLMRLVMIWDTPTSHENPKFTMPSPQKFIDGMLKLYAASRPPREVAMDEMRCMPAKLHYGMGSMDPITRIVFHDKTHKPRVFDIDHDANPLRQKLFVFWNPATIEDGHDDILARLFNATSTLAAELEGGQQPVSTPASPPKPRRPSLSNDELKTPSSPKEVSTVRVRTKRPLRFQSSCPVNTDVFEQKSMAS